MRILQCLIFMSFSVCLTGQVKNEPVTAEEAIEKVFKVLSGQETYLPGSASEKLQSGAWEALAYVNAADTGNLQKEDLQEAVPDYYRFRGKQLILKLIDQDDHNQYGLELKVEYSLEGRTINVFEPGSGALKDKWEILYLDSYYLALAMDDLHLFFTRTAVQE